VAGPFALVGRARSVCPTMPVALSCSMTLAKVPTPSRIVSADNASGILQALPPGKELASALSNLAQLHMLAAPAASAVEPGMRAVALGVSLGAMKDQAHALNHVGTAQHLEGHPDGWTHFENGVQLSPVHGC
jgi:hypothetical protein